MASLVVTDLQPGSLVGSYRIVKELGRGGFGVVYQAVHTILPRLVALKVMHGELLNRPGMATRMALEATALDGIRHPGITRVYETSRLADGRMWIAMELVGGESLAQRLARPQPTQWVAQLIANIAEVLAAAHVRGIIHRDLKPDNILILDQDPDFTLRVIDWGIARHALATRITMDGMMAGTPSYMSPEQTRGDDITPACDVYSLGVVAYEALTGNVPFEGHTIAEVVCGHLLHEAKPMLGVPNDLATLVMAMLQKDAGDRPTTASVRDTARSIAVASRAVTADERSTLEMKPLDGMETVRFRTARTELAPLSNQLRWTPEIVARIELSEPEHIECKPEKEPLT